MPSTGSGVMQEVFTKAQTTYDTMETFAATDATPAIRGTFNIEPSVNFEKTKESVGTKSLQGEVKLDQAGVVSGSFNAKPNAVGVAADIGPLFLHTFGKETIVGGTSVEYSFLDTVPSALQTMQHIEGFKQRTASGVWFDEFGIEAAGNVPPVFSFSGGCARTGWIYKDIVGVGGVAIAAVVCPLDDASIGCVEPGVVVQIGADYDQLGASGGYLVTAVDHTTGAANFTFTPALSGAGESAGASITPWAPAQTTSGTILGGTQHGLTLGGVALGFIDASIKVSTGFGPRDKEATADRPTGIVNVAGRDIEGDFTFYLLDSNTGNTPFVGRAHEGDTYALSLRLGADVAAERVLVTLPKVRLDIASIDIPEADVATFTAKIIAHQSAAALDEMTLKTY